ncbi:MAG: protein translocase subunit SecF [Dehalococcoidia bacterium]|nr:MAG: protein translocase subunit SecF [Dehalococcoidia bacterium]
MTLDLVGTRKWSFLISGITALVALVVLAIPPTFRPGIEFTAGSTTSIRFQKAVKSEDLRALYSEIGHGEARIQKASSTDFLIRTRELNVPPGSFTEPVPDTSTPPVAGPAVSQVIGTLQIGAEGSSGSLDLMNLDRTAGCKLGTEKLGSAKAGDRADVVEVVPGCGDTTVYRVVTGDTSGYLAAKDIRDYQEKPKDVAPEPDRGERTVIEKALRERFGAFEVREFSSVSATVSRATVRNTAIAVAVATLFIMIYIAFAFASLPRPFRYGACAIVALLHDVIITLGMFSLFSKLFHVEVNLMFVTGLLTVIGFSVHDTIVVYDRIRENVRQSPQAPFASNVNAALVQTIARSINTSTTVLLTVATMLLLGGTTIASFLLVIFVGVAAGTYSSIGIASQLLVAWEEGDLDRLAFWRRTAEQPAS